jgi:large subunit ribosomal protein L23Ae
MRSLLLRPPTSRGPLTALQRPPSPPNITTDDAKAKATKAAKTVKKNTHTKKRRVRTSVVFHRPRTLQLARTPKFPKQRSVKRGG